MKRQLVFGLVGGSACAAPLIRGGAAVAAGQEPAGEVVVAYAPIGCRDYSGAAAEWNGRLFLVQDSTGQQVLVEVRGGYDSLVIRNRFVDQADLVFQVALERTLREIRVPASGPGLGRMVVSRTWSERELADGGFRAEPHDAVLTCTLEPHPQPSAASQVPTHRGGAVPARFGDQVPVAAPGDPRPASPVAVDAGTPFTPSGPGEVRGPQLGE
jgi:hypothetical protein